MSGFLFSLFLISLHTIGVGETYVPFNQLEITCLFLFLALSCLLFSLLDRKHVNEEAHSDFAGSIWLGLLFVWGAIGFFYSVRPDMSFEFIAKYLTGIALLLFLHRTLRTLEQIRKLFWLLTAIAALQGVMSWIFQVYFPTVNTTINFVFINSNFRAGYLLFPLAMSATLFLTESEKTRKGIAWFLFVLIWAQLGFTNSRGAHIAAAVMMILLVWALVKNDDKKYAGLLLLGLGIGRLLFHLLFLNLGGGQEDSSFGEAAAATSSFFYRQLFWDGALQIFSQYPLTGSGPRTFSALFPYQIPFPISPIDPPIVLPAPHAHNLYLQTLSDMGLIGFGLLLTTFFSFFKGLLSFYRKNQRVEIVFALGLMIGMAGYLTHSLVETMWPSPYFLFTLVICFGSAQALIATGSPSKPKDGTRKTWIILAILVLLIGAAVLWITFSYSQKLLVAGSDDNSTEERLHMTEEASALCPMCDLPYIYRAYIFANLYEKTSDPVFRNKAELALGEIRDQVIPSSEAIYLQGLIFEVGEDYALAMKQYLHYYRVGNQPHLLMNAFNRIREKKQRKAPAKK